MLGMLVGHAGDVENDAGDVDASISRDNAVKYDTLLARTKNGKKSKKKTEKTNQNKSAPVLKPFWKKHPTPLCVQNETSKDWVMKSL